MKERIITAIDLGTTKFFGLVGLVKEENIEIIGRDIIKPESEWIKEGKIGDIDGVVEGLLLLIDSLRRQSGEKIEWVNLGVGGAHIVGRIYSQKMEIQPKGRAINENDIQFLEKEIATLILSENENIRETLCIIPQEYIIDDTISLDKKPIGMHGNTLEVRAHILTGKINPIKDIYECAKRCGIKIENLFPYAWAVAESVLNEQEKKLGCVVIDIGKSTTDIVFFYDGKIILTESLKVGSYHIDYDLSLKYHISLDFAEELKRTYAWSDYRLITGKKEGLEMIELKNPSGRIVGKATVEEISKIVHIRVKEIFEDLIIKERLLKTGLFPLKTSEVILTGGGAKLRGIIKLAENIFRLPARIGIPQKLFNLDKNYQKPEFSAGVGLLLLASKKDKIKSETFMDRVKNWFKRWFY